MPSWASLLLPKSRSHSSKQSSSSASISSLSSTSSSPPLDTPSTSHIWLASSRASSNAQSTESKRRRRKQPKPIQPRLTSLFFPSSTLSPEQEIKCIYRASHASCSDLLSGGGRPVSGFWDGGYQQANSTSLDLGSSAASTTPYSFPAYSHTVGDLDILVQTRSHVLVEETDPYLTLAPRYPTGRRVHRKSVDYTAMMARKERSFSTSGSAGIERGAELWSSPYDSDSDQSSSALSMPPPPVPARSTLRPTASASNLRDRLKATGGNPFNLSVDPLPRPSAKLSPPAANAALPIGALPPVTPPTSTSTESGFSIGRRRRPNVGPRGESASGDPNRVKDGTTSKESASGVYTPPTFPGVQGIQSKQSKVYTPSTFALPSTSTNRPFPPASPSRSTSVSSTSTTSSFGEVTTPRTPHTPLTPGGRFIGAVSGGWGSAVTGIKRASATLSTRSLSSPAATPNHSYTPTSAREGYFPPTIHEAGSAQAGSVSAGGTPLAPSFWPTSPEAPGSAKKPYGLGLGIGSEDMSSKRSRSDTGGVVFSEKFGGALVGDVPKGKRKPVPRAAGSEEIKEEDEAEIVHAL